MKKILPSRDLYLGPPDHQSSTLPTELRRHGYEMLENYLLKDFKNQAADLGLVLVDTCRESLNWEINHDLYLRERVK